MVYKRKRLRPALAAVVGLAAVVFVVWAAGPQRIGGTSSYGFTSEAHDIEMMSMPKRIMVGVVAGLMSLAGVVALVRSRHPIVIDDDGISDRAAFPERIRWPAVDNVQMVGSEKNGHRIEILSGGRGHLIEVGDVEATPGSVFQEIFETWTKRRR